jgi:hypothetical protein
MPSSAAATSPAHFLGREMVDIVLGCDRGFRGFAVRRHQARLRPDRRQWRGLRACGKHCSACNKSKGEFQKVTAFHDISLFVIWRVMRGRV